MSDSLASKTVKSAAWTYFGYILSKSSNFLTTLVLARLLIPAEFGIVGFAVTTMAFLDAVRDFGIVLALIQRRKDVERAAHTAFWLNIVTNLVIWLVAVIVSPFVADFFREPLITLILPIMSFSFVINSFGATHDALLQREMQFSKRIVPQFFNSLFKGIASITLAFMGYGVWSLVWGLLVGQTAYTILVWRVVDFRPRWLFEWSVAKDLLSYGYKISLDSFLSALQANIDYVFIGRLLGEVALGAYTIAFRVPELIIINLCTVVAQILFPAYASIQDDLDELRAAVLTALRYIAIITVPMGVGLALIATLFIPTLFGAEWTEAGPIMGALALYGLLLSISWNIGDVYKAIDRADILWKTAIFEFVLLAPILYIMAQDSAFAVAIGHVFVAFIVSMVRLIIAVRILKLSFIKTIAQFIPAGISSLFMGLAVWSVLMVGRDWSNVLTLIAAVAAGAVVYPIVLWFFERELILRVIGMARSRLSGDDEDDSEDESVQD
jgi:O-antigen/teichoic acid export membrane protein